MGDSIPNVIFLVPYRDRKEQYEYFSQHMKTILEGKTGYQIYYIHQCDKRGFNRGAMKNIGFRMVRNKWPNDYRSITLVLNDVDTMPRYPDQIDYETEFGKIKHFYGFHYTLGGIVSIKAGDFERLNGFPNFWAWGFEDNMMLHRAKAAGLQIDRSTFWPISSQEIIHLNDGNLRPVSKTEFARYIHTTNAGIQSIHHLVYSINEETGFVDVVQFFTETQDVTDKFNYDLRNGAVPFKGILGRRKTAMKMWL